MMNKFVTGLLLFTMTTAALAEAKVEQLPLAVILQSGSLAYSSQNAIKNGNPYAVLSIIGAASSIAPSAGSDKTFSSVFYGTNKKQ